MNSLLKAALTLPFVIGLAAAPALAGSGSASAESVSQELARSLALANVPTGAMITTQECDSFGPQSHFRCNVHWNDTVK